MDAIVLLAVLSYALGAIPFGLLLTKWKTGKNLKEQGSHNIGATNAARTAGPLIGVLTLLLDAGKGFVCPTVALSLGYSVDVAALCGFCAFIGHCFPIWLRFSGGKGVATALGVCASLSWWLVLCAGVGFAGGYLVLKQVGGGSIVGALVAGVSSLFLIESATTEAIICLMVIIIIIRHKDNIRRLFAAGSASVLLLVSCATPGLVSRQALELEAQCILSLQAADYQGAASRCELCLEFDETVAECINGLGLVAFAKGDFDGAKQKFAKAIQVKPTFGQARNNLGAIYFKKGEFQEALTLYMAALQLDPGYEDARYNAALSFMRIGQQRAKNGDAQGARDNYALARNHYEKLLVINSENVAAHRDLGLLEGYYAELDAKDDSTLLKRLIEANHHFKHCLQIDPKNESCHESYGQNLLFQKQFDDALYHFVQCVAENKDNPVCLGGLDAAYQGSQIKDKALARYMELLKVKPNDPQGHFGYCVALFDKSLSEQAIVECKTALSFDAKLCDAHFQLAMHYKKVLNSGDALNHCRSYLLCDDKSPKVEQVKSCQRVVTVLSGL
jgi:glycerol-3-phosphate acyltransferase PlsY